MIVTVQLGLTKPGAILAYNAPATIQVGDTVVLPPLPWQDPEGGCYGTVVGLLDDYEGWIKPIRGVVPEGEAAELRGRLARAHAEWEAERQSEREAKERRGETCAAAATEHFNIQVGRYWCRDPLCDYRRQDHHTHKCRIAGHKPYPHCHTNEERKVVPPLPKCAAPGCAAEAWRVLDFADRSLYSDWRKGTVQVCGSHALYGQSREVLLEKAERTEGAA